MEAKRKKRILITGASGFLASHLIHVLSKEEVEIFGISDLDPEDAISRCMTDFSLIDIRNPNHLREYISEIIPDLVFHLAAITNVGYSWQHAALTYEVNLNGSSNLIEALLSTSHPCDIVLLSTAELYGHQSRAIQESSPLQCRSPYALSKWAMEHLANVYAHRSELRFLIVRAFNFTGPGQSPVFVASDFARQIARIETGKSAPEMHVGNLSAQRDFSDVRDIARYLVQISGRMNRAFDTINFCSGEAVSVDTLLDILLSLSRRKITITTDPNRFRPVDNPLLLGDITRLREYGLSPQFSLEKTLSDLLDYWRQKESVNPGSV